MSERQLLNKTTMGISDGLPLQASAGGIDDLRRDIQRLMDIEAIKQLKYAYFRCIDTANMEELGSLFHDTVSVHFIGGSYEWKLEGKQEYLDNVGMSFSSQSVGHHNGHHPEIQMLSETEATGIWYLADNMWILNHKAFTTGTLRIKADSAFHVLGTLAKFRDRFPQIKIEVRTGNSHDVIQDLLLYDADIGVLGTVPKHTGIDVIKLGKSPIIAFTSKSNPIAKHKSLSFRQLADMPLVLREPKSRTRQKLEAAALAEGVVLVPAIEAEGREAVQEIVVSGTGVGFVSEKARVEGGG